jgi:hypothetical protein
MERDLPIGPSTFVVRVWLPDRPGALGQVASRIGAVRGEIVGIDILERGGGRAIDELAVELPSPDLVGLLISEVELVDGVDVEEVRPAAEALHDPRLDALETAALLVGAGDAAELLQAVVTHARRAVGAEWSAVVDLDESNVLVAEGAGPSDQWLVAFVQGSRSSAPVAAGVCGPDDVVWSPLPAAAMALVVGRSGTAYRARERRQVAAFARIVDSRLRELARLASMRQHPSLTR